MGSLPYDIFEAAVQCFGKCFHYKDSMAGFLRACAIPADLVEKDREEAKYVWGRRLLTDLGATEDGWLLQRRIVTELAKLRDLPDEGVADRDSGLEALRKLKRLAHEQKMVTEEQADRAEIRKRQGMERLQLAKERETKLAELMAIFSKAVTRDDRQVAGYELEDLLVRLFGLFEIQYRPSYRTTTQQIDGHFNFRGFDYLVEAKWRKDRPTEQEIGGFKTKVDTKFESTRGLFLSIPGFRQEVIDAFSGHGSNIILLDGSHLVLILEGRIDLRDLLEAVVSRAAQEGLVYTSASVLA